MGNHHAIAFLHLATKNALASIFLRVEDDGRTFEVPQTFVNTCGLHHATILSDITKEHGQSAILGVSVFKVADATIGTIGIKCTPLFRLRAHLGREAIARSRLIDAIGLCIHVTINNAIFLQGFSECHSIYTGRRAVNQSTLAEFVQNTKNTACTTALLNRVFLRVRSQFAEAGNLT